MGQTDGNGEANELENTSGLWERVGRYLIAVLFSRCDCANLVRILACSPMLARVSGHQRIPAQHRRANHEPGE
jgi:hypothetical protein